MQEEKARLREHATGDSLSKTQRKEQAMAAMAVRSGGGAPPPAPPEVPGLPHTSS
eukprot:SAG11_NODE_15984_length_560_cov_1.457701_2_plen_54_part_01